MNLVICDLNDTNMWVVNKFFLPAFILVPADNIVMKTLANRQNVKTFSEKVMLLVNRGGKCLKENWFRE